jgi:hypothetical protein
MKQTLKWIFVVAATASAALLGLLIIAWARSSRVSDMVAYQRAIVRGQDFETRQVGVFTSPGHLSIYRSRATSVGEEGKRPRTGWFYFQCAPTDLATLIAGLDLSPKVMGFGLARGFWGERSFCLTVPIWVPLLIVALLPARAVWLMRKAAIARWRRAHGLCPACGYDLRASSDRCPECGAAVDPAPADLKANPVSP